MNSKIKFLICALFLLTTIGAYAQNNNVNTQDYEKRLETEYKKLQSKIDADFAEYRRETQKILNEMKADIENPCQPGDIQCVCNDNIYCQDHIAILNYECYSWTKIVNTLKDKEHQKQSFFLAKQRIVRLQRKHAIADIENKQIQKITNFKELKAYLNDMPITIESFKNTLALLDKYYKNTKEQKDFIDNIIYHLQTNPVCSYELNVENYDLSQFCLLDRPMDNFPYQTLIDELEAIK